jgi:hypothetical protein
MIKSVKDVFIAIKQILKLKPYVIISRAKPSWPSAIVKIIFKRIPLIYFPYDIRALDYEEENVGIPKFEINAERYCFENADGILHKGGPTELKYLNKSKLGKDLKLTPIQISFLPYCSEEFIIPISEDKLSKKDGEIHTVNIGALSDMSPEGYTLRYCKEFVRQKIHIHLYSTSEIIQNSSIKELLDRGYFHLHSLLGPKEIIKEISKYDFGLFILPSIPKGHPEKKLELGNKISSHLEAGIPTISLSQDYEDIFVNRLIKKYKIGFCFGLKDLKNLRKRKINYKDLEKNVIKARQNFLMEKQFPRLEKFIQKVAEKKD